MMPMSLTASLIQVSAIPNVARASRAFVRRTSRDARTHGYLTYRFDGKRRQIVDVFERESLGGPT